MISCARLLKSSATLAFAAAVPAMAAVAASAPALCSNNRRVISLRIGAAAPSSSCQCIGRPPTSGTPLQRFHVTGVTLPVLDVMLGRILEHCPHRIVRLPYDFARRPHHHGVVGDLLALGDQRVRADEAILPDLGA